MPEKPVYTVMPVEDKEVKPIIMEVIENRETSLEKVDEITSVVKETVTKGVKYEIEYETEEQEVKKIVVIKNETQKPVVIDERTILVDFKQTAPVVIKDTVDQITKAKTVSYPTLETFNRDESSVEVKQFVEQSIVESKEYTIEAVKKETFGHVKQYSVLLKSEEKPPIQVTIAKDTTSKNIMVLEKKTITDEVEESVLEVTTSKPAVIEVSEIEKENIKVMSKLGLVKDIKQFNDVKLEEIAHNEQFIQAVDEVKQSYSQALKDAVIVKVVERKSLENNDVKVFYKSKDQIYEASIQLNEITGQSKLTEFIKVGTQYYPKSEVNVYSDLCYGYQVITDFSIDGNLDFITNYLKQRHDSLKDSSLIEAQQITLENGRINYKLYYKRESETIKIIVYYEPEYRRVLEIKGTNFNIGQQYSFVQKKDQVSDPYFRKLDTYIRQNRQSLGDATVEHTENKDNGQNIRFRTVYKVNGKSYRSIASINKDNQNVQEQSLSEIIEIPVDNKLQSDSECSSDTNKLNIHDLGKKTYFTESYKYIQSRFAQDLDNSQLLGASEKANFNIYTYTFYFVIDENKIKTVTVEFNPLSQGITVISEPSNIDLHDGFYPIRSDKKLNTVRNWLKENNPDLSNSVLVSSNAKKFYFGTLYKIVFKVTSKYIVYIAYVECGTKDVKIYDTQELDHFSSTPEIVQEADIEEMPANEEVNNMQEGDHSAGEPPVMDFEPPMLHERDNAGEDFAEQVVEESPEPKLKGFARPKSD